MLRVLHGGVGLALTLWPESVVAVVGARHPDRRCLRAARLVGARHLVSAATIADRRRAMIAVVVDTAHAASMVGVALVDRRRRTIAFAAAAMATSFAIAGLAVASTPVDVDGSMTAAAGVTPNGVGGR